MVASRAFYSVVTRIRESAVGWILIVGGRIFLGSNVNLGRLVPMYISIRHISEPMVTW